KKQRTSEPASPVAQSTVAPMQSQPRPLPASASSSSNKHDGKNPRDESKPVPMQTTEMPKQPKKPRPEKKQIKFIPFAAQSEEDLLADKSDLEYPHVVDQKDRKLKLREPANP